jgi:hypothetical protein
MQFEITNTFSSDKSVNSLLYTPVESPLRCRETRLYELECEGSADKVEGFVRQVLADPVSDRVHVGEAPALEGQRFLLDVWIKPGALDLEKEMILTFYRELPNPGFTLRKLRLVRRLYFFGETGGLTSEAIIKDVVNPAIQTSRVLMPAGANP